MSVNMLEMAKGAFGGDVLNDLSGLLGEDRTKTQSAIDGALPAILGGLMQGAATPQGAAEYSQMADEADTGLLDNIGGMISGNSGALLALGAPLLMKLFGARQDGLVSTIARLAGVGGGTAGTLLKVVAPLVMSMLGSKKKELNLNTDQFASMLMDQRGHVASAMPADISQSLNFSAFLNAQDEPSATDISTPAPAAATIHSTSTLQSSSPPVTEPSSGGGFLSKLLPLALVAVLGFFGYQHFAGGPDATQIEAAQTGISSLKETVGGVTSSLTGITDVESAKGVVESITSATDKLGSIDLEGMGSVGKEQVTGMLGGLVGGIESALETAYKIPGVQEVIEPAIGPFLEKLKGL